MNTKESSQPNLRRSPRHLAPRCRRRRGYLYVAVLFTTLIVVATVSVSLSISTANLRSENNRNHRLQALQMAESEIHRLAALLRNSAQWRINSTNDQFSAWRDWTVGTATPGLVRQVRHRYTDADGALDDSLIDPVQLAVHARVGDTESTVTVTLQSPCTTSWLATGQRELKSRSRPFLHRAASG